MPIYYRKPGREDEEEEKKMASIICSKINYGTVVTKNKKKYSTVRAHACMFFYEILP
jgi:hypothetical protein